MATVLLVDDESLVREELGGILEDEGFTVLTASDGEEGLSLYLAHRPDLVITDAKMPKRAGLSLARAILAEDSHVPITMITGHGSEAMAIEALRLGITDFIKKPVELTDLLAALDRMKGAARLTRHRVGDDALPTSVQLISRTSHYQLGNDPRDIPPFVTCIMGEIALGLDPRRRDSLQLALREIVINAVEHGNLDVTYQEKTEATERGTLDELLERRSRNPKRSARQVDVWTTRKRDSIEIVIKDQGDGFDWRSLPDPTDPANLLLAHGRGVLLAHLSVDEVRFNEAGNQVTLITSVNARPEPTDVEP